MTHSNKNDLSDMAKGYGDFTDKTAKDAEIIVDDKTENNKDNLKKSHDDKTRNDKA